jgi:hypothetical protein
LDSKLEDKRHSVLHITIYWKFSLSQSLSKISEQTWALDCHHITNHHIPEAGRPMNTHVAISLFKGRCASSQVWWHYPATSFSKQRLLESFTWLAHDTYCQGMFPQ